MPEAARLVEECAEAERLLAALRIVVTATLENAAVWRREGYRSVAAWMAAKTGTAVGPAIATVEMAKLLRDLPALAAAFREGHLSEVQAREIAEVASEVPDAQEQLIEAAGKLSPRGLRKESQRVEAAALAMRRNGIAGAEAAPHPGLGPQGCRPLQRHDDDRRTGPLGPTRWLCPWHHYLKTFLGYTYRGGPGTWEWIPRENRDVDLSPLRRVITSARRC